MSALPSKGEVAVSLRSSLPIRKSFPLGVAGQSGEGST
jgi:hypothetical protein